MEAADGLMQETPCRALSLLGRTPLLLLLLLEHEASRMPDENVGSLKSEMSMSVKRDGSPKPELPVISVKEESSRSGT